MIRRVQMFGIILLGLLFHCSNESAADFNLTLFPATMDAISGQVCVFLLQMEDLDDGRGAGEAVDLTATHPTLPLLLTKTSLKAGEVGELHVVPGPSLVGQKIQVKVTAERKNVVHERIFEINVVAGTDNLNPAASDIRDRFVRWLADNYPQLNIRISTQWDGTLVNPNILSDSHYLFFSSEWEMGMMFHIPPDDWAKIYLRKRSEWVPSYAFEIPSLAGIDPPHEMTVPAEVMR